MTKKRRVKGIVSFYHDGSKYENFDATRPYFVVREGKLLSCHENYGAASFIAPYSGSDFAGKEGGPAMVTNALGLFHKGIPNPVPEVT